MSGKQKGILAATGLGLFLVFLDALIANLALPDIQAQFGGGESTMQWIVVAYSVGMAIGIMPSGTFADKFGRKQVFQISVATFIAASFINGIAQELWTLVAFRGVQGVAAAAISVTSLAVVSTAFNDPKGKAKAIGIWNAVAALGLAAGPLLGGILTQEVGWRSIFFISVPIGLLVLGLTRRFVEESKSQNIKSFDGIGQLLFVIAISTFSAGIVMGPHEGWLSRGILSLFGLFIVSLAVFIWFELRSKAPMMDLRLFKEPTYAWAISAIFGVFLVVYGAFLLATQFWQNMRDFSPIETGLGLLPFAVVMILLPPRVGKYIGKVGPLRPAKFGLITLIVGCVFLTASFGIDSYTAIAFGIFGVGVATAGPALTTLAMSSVSKDRAGMASSIFSAQRALGSTVGYAVMGSILVAVLSANLNNSLKPVVADAEQREIISSSIIDNANPHAFTAEVGPGQPIPSESAATESEILDAAEDDFVRGLQISILIGAAFLLVIYLFGQFKYAKAPSISADRV